MKKKLMIAFSSCVALGGVYKFVLAKPKEEAKPNIEGTVYVLGKEFLVNLADGRFAKMTVGAAARPPRHLGGRGRRPRRRPSRRRASARCPRRPWCATSSPTS